MNVGILIFLFLMNRVNNNQEKKSYLDPSYFTNINILGPSYFSISQKNYYLYVVYYFIKYMDRTLVVLSYLY